MQLPPTIAPLVMSSNPFPGIKLPDTDIDLGPSDSETVIINPESGAIHMAQPDGSTIISFDGMSSPKEEGDHDENLAEFMDKADLAMIAEEVLRGIESDIDSRSDWEQTFNRGIDLLGLKLEQASIDASSGGTLSNTKHPILLEAVIRYQATAAAELLPAGGPVKIRDDNPGVTPDRIEMAEAYEKDFNHYLTVTAKEYYPDTRRMLFAQGFCGNAFKKVYHCPLRKRPVSDYVPAKDLIVSNDIVSLTNAGRITHRTMMRQSTLKRLQLSGHYVDTPLHQPHDVPDAVETKIKSIEGLSGRPTVPADYQYTIYETYTEYDLPGYEHRDEGGEPTGLPLPYRITIDKDSRTILEIRRNWKEGDEDFMPIQRFIKYGFVPGLGFYDYGFIHILGNTARALTAIQNQLLDAGQFSNFPGILLSDVGGRQETTQIRVPPGGAHVIRTGGMPIGNVVMALPYKEPSQGLMAVAKAVEENGRRLGGTNEVQVGEGRADVPVGTTVALIEQSTKVMAAVHKMNHESQAEEFLLLRDLFIEDPEALWKFARTPARKWQTSEEFKDVELVPSSDPNVPSRMHRIMMATGLAQLYTQFSADFERRSVISILLTTLGYSPQSLLSPPGKQIPPSPEAMAKMQKVKNDTMKQEREAKKDQMDSALKIMGMQFDAKESEEERRNKLKIQAMKLIEKEIGSQNALPKQPST